MKKKLVTARFDEEVISQILFIRDKLHVSTTTQVLKEAIHFLYNDIIQKEKKKKPVQLLEELNLIGYFKDKPSLSREYKKTLARSLEKKHR